MWWQSDINRFYRHLLCKVIGRFKNLTGNRQLRNRAEPKGINVSDILYIFDWFVEEGLVPHSVVSKKLSIIDILHFEINIGTLWRANGLILAFSIA